MPGPMRRFLHRTAIDAIIQDLQDRVRTAQEKPARQEKSVNFQNSDMLLARPSFAWNAPEQFGDHMIPDERELHKITALLMHLRLGMRVRRIRFG